MFHQYASFLYFKNILSQQSPSLALMTKQLPKIISPSISMCPSFVYDTKIFSSSYNISPSLTIITIYSPYSSSLFILDISMFDDNAKDLTSYHADICNLGSPSVTLLVTINILFQIIYFSKLLK